MGRGCVYIEGVECVHGERMCVYGRGGMCAQEDLCIWKCWSVRELGGFVHGRLECVCTRICIRG